jgi:hypothetical protein
VPAIRATRQSGGVDWQLDLERDDLLPGRLARGRLTLTAQDDVSGRSLIAAPIATEQWQHEQTTTDANGNVQTETVTRREVLLREPVMLVEPILLRRGDIRQLQIEVPVPPLGPATVDATASRLTWDLAIKVDVAGGLDANIAVPVRVLQPTATLRAGVVHVGEFALYPTADAEASDARASIAFDPMPLCIGRAFTGKLTLQTDRAVRLQEIRLEVRVRVEATVSSGLDETVTLFAGALMRAGDLPAGQKGHSVRERAAAARPADDRAAAWSHERDRPRDPGPAIRGRLAPGSRRHDLLDERDLAGRCRCAPMGHSTDAGQHRTRTLRP